MMRLAGPACALALSALAISCGENIPERAEGEPLVDGKTIATGTFEGRSDHEVTGGVEVVASEGAFFVNLGEDFSLDGAPAPRVGLGKDGYRKETQAGPLKGKTGASSYELPSGVDPEDYNEVFIWCEKFDVPLGVARLTPQQP